MHHCVALLKYAEQGRNREEQAGIPVIDVSVFRALIYSAHIARYNVLLLFRNCLFIIVLGEEKSLFFLL